MGSSSISSLRSIESISKSLDITTKNPDIFLPAAAPLVVHLLFTALAYEMVNVWLLWGGYFLASIVGFVASCVVVDMANDIINGRSMSLNKSLKLIVDRLGALILAAIISAICFITVILIPVALFIITISIVEETGALQSVKTAVNFVVKNLGEAIIFTIIVVVVSVILSFILGAIPIVGVYVEPIIMWMINVIFIVATVHFYITLRQPITPPPTSPQS